MTTNEKQKPVTPQYRDNYDQIFKKPSKLTEKILKQVHESIKKEKQND